jgi:uncharacterized protein YbaR (Trm112 family)
VLGVRQCRIAHADTGMLVAQVHVVEGQMLCPNCSHIFQIRNGIPNMVGPPCAPARDPSSDHRCLSFWPSTRSASDQLASLSKLSAPRCALLCLPSSSAASLFVTTPLYSTHHIHRMSTRSLASSASVLSSSTCWRVSRLRPSLPRGRAWSGHLAMCVALDLRL